MAAYKVEICGVNTSTLPILKEEEKASLFEKIRQGDLAARETYIKGNLRLVLSIIRRFAASNENVDDLFQIGCIGLIKSIDNFDPDMNVKFSTYAVPMIIGEIRRYLRDNNSVRVSRSMRDTAYKALHTQELMTKKNNQDPTLSEVGCRDRHSGRRDRICPGRYPESCKPLRSHLYRWRRHIVCHGSDQ